MQRRWSGVSAGGDGQKDHKVEQIGDYGPVVGLQVSANKVDQRITRPGLTIAILNILTALGAGEGYGGRTRVGGSGDAAEQKWTR